MNTPGHRRLETFDEVVEKLGGLSAVGRLCNDQDSAAVCNWKRRRSRFPTKYHKLMKRELRRAGADAPDSLWGLVDTKKKRR